MEKSERIFADSNFFIAAFRKDDNLHVKAQPIVKEFEKKGVQLVISSFVFLEIVAVLSQRVSREAAWEAGKALNVHPFVETVHITEALQKEAWDIFQQVQNKNTSFVDCSTVAVIRNEGIREIITFDIDDFQKLGKQYRFRLWSKLTYS